MSNISLNLDERTAKGKKVVELRTDAKVPSVVYGGKSDPIMTQSDYVETLKVVQAAGKHSPIDLMIGGKKKLAIIKTVDRDPVKRELRHVAFHTIKQNEVIGAEVPVTLEGMGESVAERAGLVILQAIEKIEIKAKPADLPEALVISVLNLATADDKLTIADLTLPNGVEFADSEQDTDLVIANVYEPSALQAANDAAAGDADGDVSQVEAENGADAEQDTKDDAADDSKKDSAK